MHRLSPHLPSPGEGQTCSTCPERTRRLAIRGARGQAEVGGGNPSVANEPGVLRRC